MEFDTSRNVMKFFLILPFDIFLKKDESLSKIHREMKNWTVNPQFKNNKGIQVNTFLFGKELGKTYVKMERVVNCG